MKEVAEKFEAEFIKDSDEAERHDPPPCAPAPPST